MLQLSSKIFDCESVVEIICAESRFDSNNTTTLGSCSQAVCNPLINTSDNRFSSGQGYTYDKDGNLTTDASGQQYIYDAENHQTEVKNSSNQTIGQYIYDGEGKRIKKISNTEITIFVYNGGGTLVAEYSTALANTPQVSYLTNDHLGSPRVITNQLGQVTTRKDYAAFGEEIGTSERTSGLKYDSSETRKGYTGYEKDEESGLEFAQARYYNTTHGRFTSVDPLTASATIKNPQTFNRYSYVLNSPYKYTDPLGLISSSTGACGNWCINSGPTGGYSSNYSADGGIVEEASAGPAQQTQEGSSAPPAPTAEGNEDKPELKYDFQFKGETYTYTPETVYEKRQLNPADGGPMSVPKTIETDQRDFVPTSDEVNFALSKFQSAIYANEVIAASQINAIAEGKPEVKLKQIELGVSADFGVKGNKDIKVSVSASATFEVNNADDIDVARRNADNLIQISTRNELRGLETLATGSGNTPRKLTEREISGLMIAARTEAVNKARADIFKAAVIRRLAGN